MLQQFIREHAIKSIVDLGCGDRQFSQYIDWRGVEYHGFDLADSAIKQNTESFGRDNVHFHYFDGDLDKLPDADL